mmetsp:Transcript_26512/g.52064  ORF Transcript_26512/g.52064 Transcript_26512/m.52064 type:complete len:141 (-) Transcript_26512:598-1020(-)
MDQFLYYSFPGMWIPPNLYFGMEKNKDFAPELRSHIEEAYGPIHSCFDNMVSAVGVDLFLCKTFAFDCFPNGGWTVITNGLCRLSFMNPVFNRQGKVAGRKPVRPDAHFLGSFGCPLSGRHGREPEEGARQKSCRESGTL